LTVVLRFGDRRIPRPLRRLAVHDVTEPADVDAVTETAQRVVVLGGNADLATVLTRLLRTERLGVEVAPVTRPWRARRARSGTARRVPLIRDETGSALFGTALWRPAEDAAAIEGEAVVDDTVLFDGHAPGLRVQPLDRVPGLRACVDRGPWRRRRWVAGRAAQLGTTAATVLRDGVPAPRPVRRSTFYRNTEGWLRVG
jgi:hypothetical protein